MTTPASLSLEPAKRLYDAPKQPTTEAGILNAWSGDPGPTPTKIPT